ncbi:NAD-dependent epimerase/dehydratase family protein [uncultured Amnibacterium sp.]|uniref:NAD-dependent epimerase/dehydratase family protein n=1 Tax=uncultured Amnibacterium sp. TaxID=1631851 RepID=UPI0035CB262F
MSAAEHVVFGGGAIGRAVVSALLARGETSVRVVNRSGRADVPDGVEVVGGDAMDGAFAAGAARGARVLYQVLNPRYDRWAAEFPRLQAAVLDAAEASGARLVSMENVYLYGRPGPQPFTESSPAAATTRKGLLRGRMSEELLRAHAAGRVEVAIGRASDYYGPGGGGQSNLGDRVFGPALRGGTASVLGDPDQPHTYTFIPDIAEGLVVLGAEPAAAGGVWHLPNDPEPTTTRALVERAYRAAGTATPKVRAMPPLLLKALGLVNPVIRELDEMAYEFEAPFLVDSSRITAAFGLRATPYQEGIERTIAAQRG